jgi:hypothetical protein
MSQPCLDRGESRPRRSHETGGITLIADQRRENICRSIVTAIPCGMVRAVSQF